MSKITDYFTCVKSKEEPEIISPTSYIKKNIGTKIDYLKELKKKLYKKCETHGGCTPKEIDKFYSIFKNKKAKLLISLFQRDIPKEERYYKRLGQEFYLVIEKDFVKVFIQVMDILLLAGKEIPHIIRGSSGSSLI